VATLDVPIQASRFARDALRVHETLDQRAINSAVCPIPQKLPPNPVTRTRLHVTVAQPAAAVRAEPARALFRVRAASAVEGPQRV
jgi:hypothetical protein